MSEGLSMGRVLLTGDNLVMREALFRLLSTQPHLEIVAEAASLQDTLALAVRHQPDIILLDFLLENHTGLDCIPRLREAGVQGHIIVFTIPLEPLESRRAVRLGAMGVVCQNQSVEVLLKAIESVHAGEVYLDCAVLADVLSELSHQAAAPSGCGRVEAALIASLTPRELEVFHLIGSGLKNKQIADRLCISERTLHKHLTSLYQKMQVVDRLELTIFAHRYGNAPPDSSAPPEKSS